jgi:N-acetylglucosaminyldiphosphoundecaprenol N-acetyl-beta-D-mannosaminyltransferase
VERTPTTDLAPALFERFEGGAPLRVAVVGGEQGLAPRAGEELARRFNIQIVYVAHGFHADWSEVLRDLNDARPQMILIGMGMPREAKWVAQYLAALPASVVVTCGGWFGFVVGDERRAPAPLRSFGFEWVARLVQNPRRLSGRYALGALHTGALAARLSLRRLR